MQIGPSNSLLRALSGVLQPQPNRPAAAAPAAAPAQTVTAAARVVAANLPAQNPAGPGAAASGQPLPRGSLIDIRV